MVISEPLKLSLNQLTTEAHNLQKKCEKREDVPKKELNNLEKILKNFTKEVVTVNQLADRKVETNAAQKNVDEALKAILFFQQALPPQTDAKAMNNLLARLFNILSVEMQKVQDVEKKELEKLEKKLTRQKRRGSKVEKSFQSNKLGA